jgi:hypothetical protein
MPGRGRNSKKIKYRKQINRPELFTAVNTT